MEEIINDSIEKQKEKHVCCCEWKHIDGAWIVQQVQYKEESQHFGSTGKGFPMQIHVCKSCGEVRFVELTILTENKGELKNGNKEEKTTQTSEEVKA